MLIGLPMIGVVAAGKPLGEYLAFPPQTQYVAHAPFSWTGFFILSVVFLLIVTGLFIIARPEKAGILPSSRRHFPWWGWLSLAYLGLAWWSAWSHSEWIEFLRPFKFPILWLAYILVVNAWCWRRTGRCLLTHQCHYLLLLFPLSCLFWWYFEYLNRFVQNWHYLGVEHYSPAAYVLYTSIAFSTVLPAVVSTFELLKSFPVLQCAAFRQRLVVKHQNRVALMLLILAAAGLLGIGLYPNLFFPLLWVAPLLVLVPLQVLFRQDTWFAPLAVGHWQAIVLAALAALVCGFFWEMWNYYSDPKWVYSIPYVDRFKLFEMPLLGYAGYLPFGLECMVVADMVYRLTDNQTISRDP